MRTTEFILIYLLLINPNFLRPVASLQVCYFHSKTRFRTNIAKFQVRDIDFTLCTHYVYAYAKIDNNTKSIAPQDPSEEEGPNGLYRQFVNGKKMAPRIKTMLSVGGSDREAISQFELLVDSQTFLLEFAASVVPFLRQRGFDGLEVHWISYSQITLRAQAMLLTALRDQFNDEVTDHKLILTATASGIQEIVALGNNISIMARTVDYVILSTHQLYYDEQRIAHFASPLYTDTANPFFKSLCLNTSLHVWNQGGMPFNKMVVGFTTVGQYLELINESDYHPGARVTALPQRGALYNITNGLAYPEICLIMKTSKKFFDDLRKSNYLVRGTSWVGYDDNASLKFKIDWAYNLGVAGFMIHSLDEDDFTGTICNEGKYPVMSFLKSYLQPNMLRTTTKGFLSTVPTINAGSNVTQTKGFLSTAPTINAGSTVTETTGFLSSIPTTNTSITQDTEQGKDEDSHLFLYLALATLALLGCICFILVMFCKRKQMPPAEDQKLAESFHYQPTETVKPDSKHVSSNISLAVESSFDSEV